MRRGNRVLNWSGHGAIALTLVLGAGCGRKPAPPAPPPAPRAEAPAPPATALGGLTLVKASGQVFRAPDDRSPGAPAATGALAAGEVITTGDDGGAVLRLPDGRELQIAPNARVRVRPASDGSGVEVQIDSGVIVSRTPATVARDKAVSLTILTPFGVTRVPADGASEASFTVDGKGAKVEVALGQISFVDKSGREVTAGPDESIEVTLGGVQVVRGGSPTAPAAPAETRTIVSTEPLEIVLSAEKGKLFVKRPGERSYKARRALPATPGTAYKVEERGRARLAGKGFTTQLGSKSEGKVVRANRTGDEQQLDLALAKGAATITLEAGVRHTVTLSGAGRPVSIRTDKPTTVAVAAGRKGPTLTLLAGQAEVQVGSTRRRLDPSARAEVSGKRLEIVAREASDIILPTARGLRVHADRIKEVTLSWPAELKDPEIEVATDADFDDLVLAGRVPGTQLTVPLPGPGRTDLYWRVRGAPGAPNRVQVGHARFVPDRRRSVLDLDHPENLVAENGPMTTVYFQSVLPALTFTFAPRAGASRYRVRVFRAGELGKPLAEREVNDTRCPLEAGTLKEGGYLWHAVALDRIGRELGGGRMNKLELVYDNSLTTLAIGSPKPGQRVSGRQVEVSGVAPLGSKLYVNGKAAPLDDKGRFEMRIDRAQAVIFRLVNKNGAESYFVRKLRVRS